MTTTVQVRIDQKLKRSTKKILDELGMDMSSAIKYYFVQIVMTKGIPFRMLTENGLTPAQERAINKASVEAKRGINVTRAMSPKEAIEYLKSR